MQVRICEVIDNDIIHSFVSTAPNVHVLSPAADLEYGQKTVTHADSGYHGIQPSVAHRYIQLCPQANLNPRRST
jgi:hypothetical protein